jgi:hypothetical protein
MRAILILFLTLGITPCLKAQMKDKDIYFFDDFKEGQIRFTGGSISNERVNFNYFYNQLCFLDSRTDMIMIAKNVDQIATITVDGRMFSIEGKKFFELINNTPLVQVQYKKSVRKAAKGAYGTTSETSAVESYIPIQDVWKRNENDISELKIGNMEYFYFIQKNQKMEPFRNSKQFLKLYPNHQDRIKKYMKTNSIKFDSTEQVLELIKYAESL